MRRAPGLIGTAGAVALLLAGFVGAARSQGMPQPPPLSPEQRKHLEDLNKFWQDFEQWRKRRQDAGIAPSQHDYVLWLKENGAAEIQEKGRTNPQPTTTSKPPAAGAVPRSFLERLVFHPVTWVIAIGSVVLGLAAQVYFRLTATTDPMKLAQSDPWLKAQLARQNQSSTPGVAAQPQPPID
jgi:hypothetical protein